jgi:nitroreductase
MKDVDTLEHFLTTTKQVRRRLDLTRQISLDVVMDCIDIASRAPIGGNLQINRWLLVDDADTKAKLADIYRKFGVGYAQAGRDQVEAVGRDATAIRVLESAEYLLEHLHEVPLMIVPLRLDRPGTSTFEQATFWGSVTPGVWSLQVALRSRGIGSAWTTLHLEHEDEAAAVLGLPNTVTQIALLPTGFFTGDGFVPSKRRPAAEVTYHNKWKQSVDLASESS